MPLRKNAKFFYLTGVQLLRLSRKSWFSCLFFHLWLLIAFILIIVHYISRIQIIDTTFNISFISVILTSLATYVSLWFKRHQILHLRNVVAKFQRAKSSTAHVLLKILQIINLFLFAFYPLVLVYTLWLRKTKMYISFLFILDYGKTAYAVFFYECTLPLSITLLYANFCCWCSSELKVIENCLTCPSVLKNNGIIPLLNYYQTILNTAFSIENAFSTTAFFSIASHMMIAFLYMIGFVRGYFSFGYILTFHLLFNFMYAIFCMTIVIGFASETPEIINRIKHNLCVLEGKLSLNSDNNHNVFIKSFIETYTKRETFSFTACNMVQFKRSMIIASYGTLLSYGLLLLQFK